MTIDQERLQESVKRLTEQAQSAADIISALGVTIAECGASIQRFIDSLPEDFLQQSEKGDTITPVSTDQEGGQI